MKKINKKMKKIFVTAFAIYFVLAGLCVFFEPEIINAANKNIAVTLAVGSEISLDCGSNTAPLSGGTGITAITGGTATGSFSCTVVTPDTDGYDVTVYENHKLYHADVANQRFDDYAPVSGADYAWVAPTGNGEIFGFSLDADTSSPVQLFKNNSSACNQSGGTVTDDHCWVGFPLVGSPTTVASKTSASTSDVVALNLKAEADDGNALFPASDYANTVTVTATAK
jgi:hypothetical protein